VDISFAPSLNKARDYVLSASRPGRFTAGEKLLGTLRIVGCVGCRSGVESVEEKKNPFLVMEIKSLFLVHAANSPH